MDHGCGPCLQGVAQVDQVDPAQGQVGPSSERGRQQEVSLGTSPGQPGLLARQLARPPLHIAWWPC
jgi:hypothetical protein